MRRTTWVAFGGSAAVGLFECRIMAVIWGKFGVLGEADRLGMDPGGHVVDLSIGPTLVWRPRRNGCGSRHGLLAGEHDLWAKFHAGTIRGRTFGRIFVLSRPMVGTSTLDPVDVGGGLWPVFVSHENLHAVFGSAYHVPVVASGSQTQIAVVASGTGGRAGRRTGSGVV